MFESPQLHQKFDVRTTDSTVNAVTQRVAAFAFIKRYGAGVGVVERFKEA